jgi:hypothetical protein
LEECDFLDDICLTVLSASKDVGFAAVVDVNGKLIVGKYRRRVDRRLVTTTTTPILDSSGQYHQTKNCYFFYVDYLVTAIRQFYFESSSTRGEEEKCEVDFDVININNKIKLAITPLTQCKDKFLCVYFESPVAESTYYKWKSRYKQKGIEGLMLFFSKISMSKHVVKK